MKRIMAIAIPSLVFAAITLAWSAPADTPGNESESRIQIGFAIAPVPLNLQGKNPALVGLGSYLVNTRTCNGCHTSPPFAPGHNPFLGQPEQINTAVYLAGGIGPNITPDENGLPAGMTLSEFISLMRTGVDPFEPPRIEQVMPWPAFGKMSDHDLTAMYEYLRAIPSLPDNF
jgi:hypothetical protein